MTDQKLAGDGTPGPAREAALRGAINDLAACLDAVERHTPWPDGVAGRLGQYRAALAAPLAAPREPSGLVDCCCPDLTPEIEAAAFAAFDGWTFYPHGPDSRGKLRAALRAALNLRAVPSVPPSEPSEEAKLALARIFCLYGDTYFEWDDPVGSSYGNCDESRAAILRDAEKALRTAYAVDFPSVPAPPSKEPTDG